MFIKKVNRILGYASGVMIFITGIILLYDVFARYILGAPSLWAQSVAQFLVLIATFLGTAYALNSGGHVNVEILIDRVKPIVKKVMLTVGYILSITFVFALMKSCFEYAVMAYNFAWDVQGNLPIPAVILYVVMVIGSAMLLISLIATIVETWGTKQEKGKKEAEE